MTKKALPLLAGKGVAELVIPDVVKAGGIELVVSMSGGKDSAACALLLKEAGLPYRMVFSDTTWEHEITYGYLDVLEKHLGQKIDRVKGPESFMDLARRHRNFPMFRSRWCTAELKTKPVKAYHALLHKQGLDTVSVVGIRREESDARSKALTFEDDDVWGGWVWRPIADWKIEDVLGIHRRHGLPLNPLYARGHDRVGCYPCIFADRAHLRMIAKDSPQRIDEIKGFEQEVGQLRRADNKAADAKVREENIELFARLEGQFGAGLTAYQLLEKALAAMEAEASTIASQALTFTTTQGEREDKITAVDAGEAAMAQVKALLKQARKHEREDAGFFVGKFRSDEGFYMPIDEVVKWATAERGGRDHVMVELFEQQPDTGCFRWGLCATAPTLEEAIKTTEAAQAADDKT